VEVALKRVDALVLTAKLAVDTEERVADAATPNGPHRVKDLDVGFADIAWVERLRGQAQALALAGEGAAATRWTVRVVLTVLADDTFCLRVAVTSRGRDGADDDERDGEQQALRGGEVAVELAHARSCQVNEGLRRVTSMLRVYKNMCPSPSAHIQDSNIESEPRAKTFLCLFIYTYRKLK
jgi:hypothetical protein